MKTNKKTLTLQRRALDQKLGHANVTSIEVPPRRGWIKAVRESLMMTTSQLASRMGIAQAVVTNMERREAEKVISLQTLERAAKALNCRLVYAFIPLDGSLETTLDKQALGAAEDLAKSTAHSMSLEAQDVVPKETSAQIKDLAFELKQKGDRQIWNQAGKVRLRAKK